MIRFRHLMRWQLRTLLLLVAAVAVALAVWSQFLAPYNRQRLAQEAITPFVDGVIAIPAKPKILSRLDSERFVQVVEVFSRKPELDDETLAPVAKMPFLRRLYLNRTRVGDRGMPHIGNLKGLLRLSLWGTRVTDEGLSALGGCQSLQAIDLHNTGVSDAGLRHLETLTSLREVIVGEAVYGPGLESVARLPNLRFLDLSRSGVHFEQLHHLVGSPVRELVFMPKLPAEVVPTLVGLPELVTLNTQIVHADDAVAKQMVGCRNLRLVDVAGVGITDDATAALITMPNLNHLRVHGALTDRSLEVIEVADRLVTVRLVGRFTIAAMERLARQRPDLDIELRTVIPHDYRVDVRCKNLRVESLIERSRIGTLRRARIHWPAVLADMKTLSADARRETEEVHLKNPPSLPWAFPDSFQREWSISCDEGSDHIKHLWTPRLGEGEISKIRHWSELRSAIIDDASLTDRELAEIEFPDGFESLVLTPSRVSREGLTAFRKRFPLVSIRQNGHGRIYDDHRWQSPRIGQGSVDDILTFPDVRVVQLSDVRSTIDLTPLAAMPHLERLSFHGPVAHAPIWINESKLSHVKEVHCAIRSFNDGGLGRLSKMPALEKLLLRDATVTDSGFASLTDHAELREVDIQSSYVTGSGLRHLAECRKLTRVRIDSPVFDDRHLVHLKNLPDLRELEIRGSTVGDAACNHFAEFTSLERLYLPLSEITDHGLRSLGQSKRLESLVFVARGVTDDGMWELAKCPKLTYIRMGGSHSVSRETRRRIKAVRRGLEIK